MLMTNTPHILTNNINNNEHKPDPHFEQVWSDRLLR